MVNDILHVGIFKDLNQMIQFKAVAKATEFAGEVKQVLQMPWLPTLAERAAKIFAGTVGELESGNTMLVLSHLDIETAWLLRKCGAEVSQRFRLLKEKHLLQICVQQLGICVDQPTLWRDGVKPR
ncbi:hypothetical protein OS189_12420 [Sulfitobacter sp. F26169L]|uniref:hypothetical protein n=1 Tax=Sulfitobacter sp. F26169L TaxID=2996015 RepID=UPI002260F653|nr:hypothetical protein [Sulfitobacter sp. F26169L]MCX7567149.1 hypothetical protein [Sulfitobacter sp. F26169L]